MNYSGGILKPDCIERGLEDTVFSLIKSAGLDIVLIKRLWLSLSEIRVIYDHCIDKPYFDGLANFMMSNEVVYYVISGKDKNVHKVLDRVVGHTDPKKSEVGTIRKMGKNIRYNLIHSTSNDKTFLREVRLLLTEQELNLLFLT